MATLDLTTAAIYLGLTIIGVLVALELRDRIKRRRDPSARSAHTRMESNASDLVAGLRDTPSYELPQTSPALSAREQEIGRLAALGMSNKEIAQATHLSVHTVSSYLKRVYAKLGIQSRVELSRHLHRLGHSSEPPADRSP